MIDSVDENRSGEIEFPEFCSIILNSGGNHNSASAKMTIFFKKLTSGEIGMKDLSFSTFVNGKKREKLIDAITAKKGSPRCYKGTKMLKNIRLKIATEKVEEFEK